MNSPRANERVSFLVGDADDPAFLATLPIPPPRNWIGYSLRHPRHFAIRLWQISTPGNGILSGDTESLRMPQAEA